ncbi:MAG TPA: hypothetical protein VF408_07455 [Sediminibacterium sp.]
MKRWTVLVMLMCCCNLNYGRTIYVSPAGTGNGTAPRRALASINAAIAMGAAGDTVLLQEGVYKERIRISKTRGSFDKPLYILGQGANTLVDGGATVPGMDLDHNWIELSNTAWIVIADISFINGWTDPIRINNASYISFQRCRFKGGRKVILATGAKTHHVLVEDCYWDQGGMPLWTIDKDIRGVDAWLSMHHELMGYYNGSLIDSRASGGSFVIRRNRISNAYNGIRFTSKKGYDANIEVYDNELNNIRDNDFEPEHYAYNLHIYHNRSHNIHKSFSVDDVAGGYIYYYGNIITMDSSAWARQICSGWSKIYGGTDSMNYPLYFFNNSFFGYGKAFNAMEAPARMLKHYNNAYYFAGTDGWVLNHTHPTDAFDYDISNKTWSRTMSAANWEKNGLVADVLFADPLNRNLHLMPSSPAIDAGRKLQFPELGWEQSFIGKGVDMGAYEANELVEGPAFRFRKPEDAMFNYVETPRIVRYTITKNALHLFFSDAIDTSSVKTTGLWVYDNGKAIQPRSIRFGKDAYELIAETGNNLGENLSIQFVHPPVSIHGAMYTNWASAIPIKK